MYRPNMSGKLKDNISNFQPNFLPISNFVLLCHASLSKALVLLLLLYLGT